MSAQGQGYFPHEVRVALEDLRSQIREDVQCELEAVKKGLSDIKSELLKRHPLDADSPVPAGVSTLEIQEIIGDIKSELLRANAPVRTSVSSWEVQSMPSLRSDAQETQATAEDHYNRLPVEDFDIYFRVDDFEDKQFEKSPTVWRSQRSHLKKDLNDFACTTVKSFVESMSFEYLVGLLVALNLILIGIQAEVQCAYKMHPPARLLSLFESAELGFAAIFLTEWCLKVYALRRDFFCGERIWKWNMFDSFILVSQLCEQALFLVQGEAMLNAGETSHSHLSVIRVLRLLRILRIMRFLRLFSEFGLLVQEVVESVKALIAPLLLLTGTVYGFSVFFSQRVALVTHGHMRPELASYFGNVGRTYLTLIECMLGGVDWDSPLKYLLQDVGSFSAVIFVVFNIAGLFILVNTVSGEFLSRSMKVAGIMEDRSIAQELAVVLGLSTDGFTLSRQDANATRLDYEGFKEMFKYSAMQNYFKSIDLPIDEAHLHKFFTLLDADGSGDVDAAEVYAACLRLRGPLRAVDIAMHSSDNHELLDYHSKKLVQIERLAKKLCHALHIKDIHETRKVIAKL